VKRVLVALALLAAGAVVAPGAPARAPGFRLVKVGGFKEPLYVTAPPGDRHRVMVVEQSGRIIELHNGRRHTFLDIHGRVRDVVEQGLLSMAFAPDYAKSHLFYVFYTANDAKERVEEYRATTRDHASAASARTVLTEDDPEENNNGGQLQFGPDGYLYIANGDGGGEEAGPGDPHGEHGNAQDLGSLFGKILRIDPRGSGPGDYTVPASNPFHGDGQRPEIYAYGVRNPWRFSFDAKTGALIVADVGRGAAEEIDYFKRGQGLGANLGWRVWEGTHRYHPDEEAPGAVFPALEFNHTSDNFCAITGGYVSRDPKVKATYGRYLFADFCHGWIFTAHLGQPTATASKTSLAVPELASFGQDARGRVYVVSIAGRVFRIAAPR
jgi:glucose/arabinose dehydrogenase